MLHSHYNPLSLLSYLYSLLLIHKRSHANPNLCPSSENLSRRGSLLGWRVWYPNLVVLKNTAELLDLFKQLLQEKRSSLIDITFAIPVNYNEK